MDPRGRQQATREQETHVEFTLVIRGTTQLGTAAGTGGAEFKACDLPTGDMNQQVLYVDATREVGFIRSVYEKLKSNRSDLKIGYMAPSDVSNLADQNVLYDPQRNRGDLERIGPACYALYRYK
jgi:hypothetical protein